MTRWSLPTRVLVAWTVLVPAALGAQRGAAFPHRQHGNLFPTCTGCHAGISTGNTATSFPAPEQCRLCHNGTDVRAVTWTRPTPHAGMLKFSHPVHARSADSAARACATCHSPGDTAWMNVSRPVPATCLSCHTHAASGHLADDNACATCHIPLTQARDLTRERIAAFPRPPSHERSDFVSHHAPAASDVQRCAVCHARESCARCHVNASTLPAITALDHDPRVAALVAAKAPVYPTPADHRTSAFSWDHGSLARTARDRCATCHTRASCETCHTNETANPVVRGMPRAEGGAPGVQLVHPPMPIRAATASIPSLVAVAETIPSGKAPAPRMVRVHDPGFRTAHGSEAASGALTCTGCHAQRFCADCHAGEGKRRFHPTDYVSRHAANAWGRETECSSCHNAQAFCKGCHEKAGLASKGRLDVAYHSAQPQWLLQHGRAARQGLANCTTCHTQRDCLTCHSTVGWGINPHGPGFDAARMAKVAAPMCLACHLQVPGRSP